jgi:hypothetical protein
MQWYKAEWRSSISSSYSLGNVDNIFSCTCKLFRNAWLIDMKRSDSDSCYLGLVDERCRERLTWGVDNVSEAVASSKGVYFLYNFSTQLNLFL